MSDDRVLEVDVDVRVRSPNRYDSEHIMARVTRRKREHAAVAKALEPFARPDLEGEHVTITLTRMGPRELDDDNLAYAFKSIRDEVANWLGVDDADKRLSWRYAQVKVREKTRRRVGFKRGGSKVVNGLRVWARLHIALDPVASAAEPPCAGVEGSVVKVDSRANSGPAIGIPAAGARD